VRRHTEEGQRHGPEQEERLASTHKGGQDLSRALVPLAIYIGRLDEDVGVNRD
jgi:hypothetical protein